MDAPPDDLLAALPPGSHSVASAWWNALPDEDRARIRGLWDERLEVRFFTPQTDGHCVDDWAAVPTVTGGKFVPHDDDGSGEWGPGYFEHLLQHPELLIAYDPSHRTFHLGCTLHAAARRCIADGRVPADFVCPVGSAGCLLVPLRGATLTRPGIDRGARS